MTLFLKSVSIKDALDIILISNNLAYQIQKEIIHVMSETEFQEAYGRKFNDQSIVKTIHLQYSKPGYVLSTLDSIKSSLGKIVIDEDTGTVVMIDTPEAIEKMLIAIADMEAPLTPYTYNLQYAKADVVAEKLRTRIEENAVGTITADERSNSIVIRALPDRLNEIVNVVRSLDTQTKEVLVEVQVLQVSFKPQLDYGIDWTLDFLDSSDKNIRKLKFENVFLDLANLTSGDDLYSQYAQIGAGAINADHFVAAIRALKQVNDTKILSSPKLLVANNEEARIHVGDTVPYIVSTTSGTGDNAITSEDVRFIDVGLKLTVTANINDEGFVTMNLISEISGVVAEIESQSGGIPQVNKTEVETTMMVKDGTTIIMGGLKKDIKRHVKKGFPFLMDIPFLGVMFSSVSDEMDTTEIVILITPHVMTGVEHYEDKKGTIKPYKNY